MKIEINMDDFASDVLVKEVIKQHLITNYKFVAALQEKEELCGYEKRDLLDNLRWIKGLEIVYEYFTVEDEREWMREWTH